MLSDAKDLGKAFPERRSKMARKKRRRKVRNAWSKDEVRLLKKIFRNMSTAEAAEELGRSVGSVHGKASALGLRKTKKYLKSIGRT